MSAQRYSDPAALERMSRDMCPECGHPVARHDGWGGPQGCSLTDTGVAARIAQYRSDRTTQAVTEYGIRYKSGDVKVRYDGSAAEAVYPLDAWIADQKADGGRVVRRTVLIIEDWTAV